MQEKLVSIQEKILKKYRIIREHSQHICQPLQIEDYVVQPIVDVSPPKWHLGHTTWFFETFVLKPYFSGYKVFNDQYDFVFKLLALALPWYVINVFLISIINGFGSILKELNFV